MNGSTLCPRERGLRPPFGLPAVRLARYAALTFLFTCTAPAGCDLFHARTPEPPEGGTGTWLQPDTPERVVENIQTALAELNTQNYLRSLSEALVFEPTQEAVSREPVFTGWSRAEEEAYFTRLRAAAEPFTERKLQLFDTSPSFVGASRYVLHATYLLTVRHSRIDEAIPSEVQGRLAWEIVQGGDGLWRLERWTDQELGTFASWSDLKAAFVK